MDEKILRVDSEILANRLRLHSKSKYGVDIVTIITIVSIIIEIVKAIYKFFQNRNKDAAQAFKEMGPLVRFIMWWKIKKNAKDRTEAKHIQQALYDLVYNLKEEEVNKLFQVKG